MQPCQRCCVCVSAVSPASGMFTSHFVCLYAFLFIVFFFCSFLCFVIFAVVCYLCPTISGVSFVVLIHRLNIFGCLFVFFYIYLLRSFVCLSVVVCHTVSAVCPSVGMCRPHFVRLPSSKKKASCREAFVITNIPIGAHTISSTHHIIITANLMNVILGCLDEIQWRARFNQISTIQC